LLAGVIRRILLRFLEAQGVQAHVLLALGSWWTHLLFGLSFKEEQRILAKSLVSELLTFLFLLPFCGFVFHIVVFTFLADDAHGITGVTPRRALNSIRTRETP